MYAIVVGFYASVIFFTSAMREETTQVLRHVPQLWVQRIAGGRLTPAPAIWQDSLVKWRGVKQVVPRIWGYYFDSPTGAVCTLMGSDSLLAGLSMLQTIQKGKLKDNEILVGKGLLDLRGLQLGETITLYAPDNSLRTFKIVGVFTSESDLLTKDLLILSPASARLMLSLPTHEVTDFAVEIYNPLEVNNIGKKIDHQLPQVRVVTQEQLRATYQALFSWRGGILVYGSLMAFFAFLILAWERASGLSEQEHKELAILKAVGWQIGEVLRVKMYEGLIISLSATLLGVLLAYWHVFVFDGFIFRYFLVGWSVVYPHFKLLPVLHIGDWLNIMALSVVPYLSATLIPAWRGAITDPAEIMRR
jgi:ABC-type lipoprotein release transport system permease subunit